MYNGKVSRAACEELRSVLKQGALMRTVADAFGISIPGVAFHRDGKCKHVDDIAVDFTRLLELRKVKLRSRDVARDVLWLRRYQERKSPSNAERIQAYRVRERLRKAAAAGLLRPGALLEA